MTSFIDPDCRDPYKHGTCAGGACECACHEQTAAAHVEATPEANPPSLGADGAP